MFPFLYIALLVTYLGILSDWLYSVIYLCNLLSILFRDDSIIIYLATECMAFWFKHILFHHTLKMD